MNFSAQDLDDLGKRGISRLEAERQLGLFLSPPPAPKLERPCTVGEGILRLSEAEQVKYERLGLERLKLGSVAKFVPASGAATRLFKDLLAAETGADGMPNGPAAEALVHAERFAFYGAWKQALGTDSDKAFAMRLAKGQWKGSLEALLGVPGLDYASQPKALLPFHTVDGSPRTALEEQVHEALQLGLDHIHFTVSAGHQEAFEAQLRALELPLPFSLSEQSQSTDTLAAEADGRPFRDAAGRLVFRPGGHGALLHNVQALANAGHTTLLIKNIDNIAHPHLWPVTLKWKRILVGLLDEIGPLDCPVRVAGVVPNTGQPGGGPFFVGGKGQIIESAQVGPSQKAVFAAGTHFNPVDLACRLTDKAGKPFDLEAYSDPNAVFFSDKSHLGRPLRALELPGLWNGGMAEWRTVFVEVPLETFNPVKTVNDLLRPVHQPK